MAILDYGITLDAMSKYMTVGPESVGTITVASGHPFFTGVFPVYMVGLGGNNYSSLNPKWIWDFSAAPGKPVLGDTLAFRWSLLACNVVDQFGNGASYANQYLIQFVDASGNVIGGLRHTESTATANAGGFRSYYLAANGTTEAKVSISGALLFPVTSSVNDFVITCNVTSTQITVSLYRNTPAESLANTPPTLIATITAAHANTRGAPAQMKFMVPNSSSSRDYGKSPSAIAGCILAVNEDLLNAHVGNTLVPVVTGAYYSDLNLLSSIYNSSVNGNSGLSAYLESTRDLRRSFKLSPVSGCPFPATDQILDMKATFTYGLSKSAKLAYATQAQLEAFIRKSGVNYSLGRVGVDGGSQQFTIAADPETGTPFASYNSVEFGFVLREKI